MTLHTLVATHRLLALREHQRNGADKLQSGNKHLLRRPRPAALPGDSFSAAVPATLPESGTESRGPDTPAEDSHRAERRLLFLHSCVEFCGGEKVNGRTSDQPRRCRHDDAIQIRFFIFLFFFFLSVATYKFWFYVCKANHRLLHHGSTQIFPSETWPAPPTGSVSAEGENFPQVLMRRHRRANNIILIGRRSSRSARRLRKNSTQEQKKK